MLDFSEYKDLTLNRYGDVWGEWHDVKGNDVETPNTIILGDDEWITKVEGKFKNTFRQYDE